MRSFNYIIITVFILFIAALPATAQQRLSFSLNNDDYKPAASRPIDASRFTNRRSSDYLHFGFQRVKTHEEKKTEATDRYIRNLITNKNKNGFVGNLLGLQRVRPARGGVPRF